MPLTPKARTRKTPRNKSVGARDAEARGERTWTKWRLRDLIDQVLRINTNGVQASDLRNVRNLEYLKVKLLEPTARHHTGLRMPDPVTFKQDQYFGLSATAAKKLQPEEIARWRARPPSADELDQAVENLTGRRYYRERRR